MHLSLSFDSFPFCINSGRGQHVSKPCKRVYVDKKRIATDFRRTVAKRGNAELGGVSLNG